MIFFKHYCADDQRIANKFARERGIFNSRQAQSERSKEGVDTQNKQSAAEADFKNYFSKAGFEKAEIEKEFAKAPAPVGSLYYLHGDHLGTATYVTNEYAEPTQFFLNLPFGETMVEQQEPTAYVNPYKFNAKELDSETGLYYYGARYYNPRLSIWYGVDPLAEKMPSWSPYAYAFDNPVRFIDPDGRKPLDWYQNKKTGNYEWKDTNKKIAGFNHLGKSYSFGEANNGQDRMYYLHANGSATEKTGNNSFTLSHVENSNSIRTINGESITSSATSVSGLAVQGSYTKQLIGPLGVTGSLGYVADADTGAFGGKFYFSAGWSMSISGGVSGEFMAIKASNPEALFNARRDFEGFGNTVSGGFGGGFILGASSVTQDFFGSSKDYNPMQAGRYDGGYTTAGVTYGFGKPSIGASISRTHTQFIDRKLIKKIKN